MGKKVDAILVSTAEAKTVRTQAVIYYAGLIDIYCFEDFPFDKNEVDVLIAVNESLNEEIRHQLMEEGFSDIYMEENWKDTNQRVRQQLFLNYLSREGATVVGDVMKYKEFKIAYLPEKQGYNSMLMGEFNDIIAPSIFDDYSSFCEGPYEYGEVRLRKGDIVIDGGANIGMFSAVAVSKDCISYAFEPEERMRGLLENNARLMENIKVVPYALFDKKSIMTLTITDDMENYGDGSLIYERGPEFKREQVQTISIDEFVKEQGLERVDFIKADIEGAERYMLTGAKETLAKFAPRLALCTYHLPDDPQVMENLILRANPEYVITHKWKKLYAYVPQK